MKVGAFILGLLGGLFALLMGSVGYTLGSVGNSIQRGAGTNIQFFSLAIPITALAGAGIVLNKPKTGAALMAGAAVALILYLGFNFATLIPVVLLGLGAGLGFMEAQQSNK